MMNKNKDYKSSSKNMTVFNHFKIRHFKTGKQNIVRNFIIVTPVTMDHFKTIFPICYVEYVIFVLFLSYRLALIHYCELRISTDVVRFIK